MAYASARRDEASRVQAVQFIRSSLFLRWPVSEGRADALAERRYLRVTGLANIIQVFDDIEKGRLRNVDFIEAHRCWGGCTGGNLTVANVYMTPSRFHSIISSLPEVDPAIEAEIERRFPADFALERPIPPRPVRGFGGSLRERVRMIQEAEATLAALPGLNCGLCGAPTCKDLARDMSIGDVGLIRKMAETEDPGSREGCCFLAVVGASGSGKSTIVRAGVVPGMLSGEMLVDGTLPPEGSQGWHIHVLTPTSHRLEALAISLLRETKSVSETARLMDDLAKDGRSLNLYAQHLLAPVGPGLTGKCRLLLIIDQFEELFTLCRSEAERQSYLDNLFTAVAGGGPTQVIIVLRARCRWPPARGAC